MKNTLYKVLFTLVLSFMSAAVFAQGVTSAAIQGSVTDENGEELIGATVVAVHQPTGTKYGTTTNLEGGYILPNVKTGGPYTLNVSYIGYQSHQIQDFDLALGQKARFDVQLESTTQELETVVVTANKNQVINSNRTGAATNISTEQIESMPTLSRGIADFARLTPQFTQTDDGGMSFGGQNNRFNNVMIDGAVNNDVFGLDASGSPGGRTGSQPISLDAIKEIQVLLAPYDVRQSGFTGAGVNAITRNGTNQLEGSVFTFLQNENLAGKSIPTDFNPERESLTEFQEIQTGFRLGGPIVKDKLFFFVNGEYTQDVSPYSAELRQHPDSIAEFLRITRDVYGYDPQDPYQSIEDRSQSRKLFVRFDWNINDVHKLVVRNNYNNAFTNDIFRSANDYSLNSSQAAISSVTNSFVVELNSNFNSNLSNELRIGYTRIADERQPVFEEQPFPQIEWDNTDQDLLTGPGRFNALNSLNQDLIEITDNLTLFKGDHTFTVGTRNELYFFDNLFIESGYGEWIFSTLTDYAQGNPASFRKDYSLTDNYRQSAKWGALQLGLYAQDEWAVRPNLTLTMGVRADLPLIVDEVTRNPKFEKSFGLRNDLTPQNNILFSPRVGFNWDVFDNGETQLRGGTGIFSGRAPFVWLSNQYTKNGIDFGSARFGLADVQTILEGLSEEERIALINDPYFLPDPSLIDRTVEVDITNPDLRMPQTFRSNLAVDQVLPWNVIGTFEAIYSKTLNDIYTKNLNLVGVVDQNANGRNLWGYGPNQPAMVDSRNFTDIYMLENTNQGYQVNLSAKLQKNVRSFFSSIAYNYGISKDIKSGTNSIAGGNWASAPIVQDANNPMLAYSNFDVPHRIVGNLGYTFNNYSKFAATTFSLFYNGQSGRRFSYIYAGDANFDARDVRTENDLIFIPEVDGLESGQIIFSGDAETQQSQWEAFNAYIENDPYLSRHRGQFAGRNAAIAPWRHTFDLAVKQSLKIKAGGKTHNLQLSADIFNVGNLLNVNWGNSYSVRSNSRILTVTGIDEASKLPVVSFSETFQPYFVNRFGSVWRMQLGARYTF